VKAFIYAQGEEIVLGHSVAHLLKHALRYDPDLEEILGAGGLDKYYIPTRYPNGLPGGLPFEAFDEGDASKAIGMAARVVRANGIGHERGSGLTFDWEGMLADIEKDISSVELSHRAMEWR